MLPCIAIDALQAVRRVLPDTRLTSGSLSIRLAPRITPLALRSVWAVPERVRQRNARLACCHPIIRLAARVTPSTRVSRRRDIRVTDGRARLAPCPIGERLRTCSTRHARHTIRAVKVAAQRQTQVAIALIILRLRPRRTRNALSAIAVLARATCFAATQCSIRLVVG